jgi:hypothetical protein
MSLGSVVTLGFSPGGRMSLLPTIGYSLGGAGPAAAADTHGADDEIDYVDQRRIRRQREDREIMRIISQFLKVI